MAIPAANLTRRTFLGATCALPFIRPALAAGPATELYDSHLHFFTDDIAHYPIDTRNSREGEETTRARILSHPNTPETIFALWAQTGVTGGTGVQYKGAYKTDNSYLLDLADDYPDKIHAEVLIQPGEAGGDRLLHRLATTRRVAAARLAGFVDGTTDIGWLNSPAALEIWAVANRLALPVGITFLPPQGTEAALRAVHALADRFPLCPIVLEHLGRLVDGDISPAHLALAHKPNIHFKWTTNVIDELKAQGRSPSVFLRLAAETFGADRLMWGSDCGNTLRPYGDMVADAIASTAQLTATDRRLVLHDNGLTLFNRARTRAVRENS